MKAWNYWKLEELNEFTCGPSSFFHSLTLHFETGKTKQTKNHQLIHFKLEILRHFFLQKLTLANLILHSTACSL